MYKKSTSGNRMGTVFWSLLRELNGTNTKVCHAHDSCDIGSLSEN